MKYLIISALALQIASSQCMGNQTAKGSSQFKIQVEFKNLDKKWLSGLQHNEAAGLTKENGNLLMPSLMTPGGFPANLKIIQEYDVRLGGPVIPCGILFDLNPAFNGDTIQVFGTSTLRYPTDKSDSRTASHFITQENIVDLTLKDGETKTINLDGEGEMLITVTLHNSKGERVANPPD